MKTLMFAFAVMLPMSAYGATMCNALRSIDIASLNGFRDLPTHPAKGMPNGVPDAVIPGGSSPSLGRGMGTRSNEMQFSVTFVDAKNLAMLTARYADAKEAIISCLPGTKAIGNDIYQTPNDMRIELVQDLGGFNFKVFQGSFTFISTMKPLVASEQQTPVAKQDLCTDGNMKASFIQAFNKLSVMTNKHHKLLDVTDIQQFPVDAEAISCEGTLHFTDGTLRIKYVGDYSGPPAYGMVWQKEKMQVVPEDTLRSKVQRQY